MPGFSAQSGNFGRQRFDIQPGCRPLRCLRFLRCNSRTLFSPFAPVKFPYFCRHLSWAP